MPTRTPLPLGFNFYQSDSLTFSAQRCINWIAVAAESGALNDRMLMQPLGLKQLSDPKLSTNRGGWEMGEQAFFVQGNSLVLQLSNGTFVNKGTIPGNGRVSMASNARNVDTGQQFIVIVVPGDSAHVYDSAADTVTQITDPDFRVSDTVIFNDGFFLFSASDGSVWFNSALNDPFTFDGLDFGTAEIDPDRVVALHSNHNEVFVGGLKTYELFDNVGGSGFPYQRIPGANIQKGVHAKFSLVEFDSTFCFVGGGLNEGSAVWKVTGSSNAVKISTNAIDTQIQKFTRDEISSAFALTYSDRGQFLAIFTFESERIPSRTFFYNATASALLGQSVWGEFQTGVTDDRFRVQSIVSAYGKLLVGDDRSSIIGELDHDTLTYYDGPIFMQSASQPFNQEGTELFAGSFEATFQSGVGLTAGNDPQVRLDHSDDEGNTFPGGERSRGIGKIGKYGQRAVWERQGSFPVSRTVRLTCTDPVRRNLIRLAATPDLGTQ